MSSSSLSPADSSNSSATTDRPVLKSYRRPYKKSLSGCKACKGRKVKCDEQKPVCANCKKRFVDVTCCEYPTKYANKVQASSGASSSKITRHVPFKPFDADQSTRVLELRLLHHYTESTCQARRTLNEMAPILNHPFWGVDIPQMAFSSPIVLDALLGVSALHLFALQPGDQSLAVASRSYFNKALTKQREELSTLSAGNAEALLVSAVLIAHQAWLTAHYTPSTTDDRYNLSLETYRMCQGITALMEGAAPWLEKYTWMAEEFQLEFEPQAGGRGFVKSALEDLASISEHFSAEAKTLEDIVAYESMSQILVSHYTLLVADPMDVPRIEQSIVTVLHRVPPRFPELLAREDPIAMALLARNLCLLSFLESSNSWWIHGAGQAKVPAKAVFGIRNLMPVEYSWTLKWPMNVIAKEITLGME